MTTEPNRWQKAISDVWGMDYINAKKVINTKMNKAVPNPQNLTLAERILLNRNRGQALAQEPRRRDSISNNSVDISDLTNKNGDSTPTPEPTLRRQDTRRSINSINGEGQPQPGPSNQHTPPLPPITPRQDGSTARSTPRQSRADSRVQERRVTPVLPPIAKQDNPSEYSGDSRASVQPPQDTRQFDPDIGVAADSPIAKPVVDHQDKHTTRPVEEEPVRRRDSPRREVRDGPVSSTTVVPVVAHAVAQRRSRSRSRSRDKDKRKSRSRSRSKERKKSRSRSRSRDRGKAKQKSRGKSRSRSRSRKRSRSRSRSRTRSPSRSRRKSRSRSKARHKSRSRRQSSSSHSRSPQRHRHSHRSRSRKKYRSPSYSSESPRRRSKSRQRRARSYDDDYDVAKSLVRSLSRMPSFAMPPQQIQHQQPVEYQIIGGNPGYWPERQQQERTKKIIILQNAPETKRRRHVSSSDSDINVVVKTNSHKSRQKREKVIVVSESSESEDEHVIHKSKSRKPQKGKDTKRKASKKKQSKTSDIDSDDVEVPKQRKKKSSKPKVQEEDDSSGGNESPLEEKRPKKNLRFNLSTKDKQKQKDDEDMDTATPQVETPSRKSPDKPAIRAAGKPTSSAAPAMNQKNRSSPKAEEKEDMMKAIEQLDKRADFEIEQLKGGNMRKLPPDVDLDMKKKIFSKEFQESMNHFLSAK